MEKNKDYNLWEEREGIIVNNNKLSQAFRELGDLVWSE